MSPTSPFLADVDIGQVVLVIVALAVGFIQWVIKTMKERNEAAGRTPRVSTEEENEARRRAWEEQTRTHEAPPPAKTQSAGGTFADMMAEVRKAIADASEPKAPPPLPPVRPAMTRPYHDSPPNVSPSWLPEVAPAMMRPLAPLAPLAPAESHTIAVVEGIGSRRAPHPLTRMLHTPEGYRQAFVLREVLGPPRALREYGGPED